MRATGLALAVLAGMAGADIIGIDFGSEFMKLALIQPGKGMQIVTNVESKRKTPTRVGVKPDDSLVFGSNAVALEARSPEFTFPQARVLLGRSASHPAVTELLANGFYPQPVACLLYTSPSPRDQRGSRMPSSA